MPRTLDWYWAGSRAGRYHATGHLYHNDRDGWMYTETIYSSNRWSTRCSRTATKWRATNGPPHPNLVAYRRANLGVHLDGSRHSRSADRLTAH